MDEESSSSEWSKSTSPEEKFHCHIIVSSVCGIISAGFSLASLILYFAIPSGENYPQHIVARSLDIIDFKQSFALWCIHSICLALLPPFIAAYSEKWYLYMWIPPLMSSFNFGSGFIECGCGGFLIIFEVFMAFALFIFIFKKTKENIIVFNILSMMITFVYISAALGASSVPYTMFNGRFYENADGFEWKELPFAIEYYQSKKSILSGECPSFLLFYSLFVFFIMVIGVAIAYTGSLLSFIPFIIISSFTVISEKVVGTLFFVQAILILIQFFVPINDIEFVYCNCTKRYLTIIDGYDERLKKRLFFRVASFALIGIIGFLSINCSQSARGIGIFHFTVAFFFYGHCISYDGMDIFITILSSMGAFTTVVLLGYLFNPKDLVFQTVYSALSTSLALISYHTYCVTIIDKAYRLVFILFSAILIYHFDGVSIYTLCSILFQVVLEISPSELLFGDETLNVLHYFDNCPIIMFYLSIVGGIEWYIVRLPFLCCI